MSKNYYNCQNQGCENHPPKCGEPCKPHPVCPDDSYVIGNSVDFTVDNCDSEIKADVTVSFRDSVRVWGQIKDCDGKPVEYAYLKLIKITNCGYEGVAHTITDCLGFYQFDICPCKDGSTFRLLVSKASIGGNERTLQVANCNPCEPNWNPCGSNIPQCDCR